MMVLKCGLTWRRLSPSFSKVRRASMGHVRYDETPIMICHIAMECADELVIPTDSSVLILAFGIMY